MLVSKEYKKPTKEEQKLALESYDTLASAVEKLPLAKPEIEIEIEETKQKIKLPISVLKLLLKMLKAMGQGKFISLVPISAEITTQKAAEILGCSRPHLVKLLEGGEIAYTKVGRHRRIKYEDVINYKKQKKAEQKSLLVDMMQEDEKLGLYDS